MLTGRGRAWVTALGQTPVTAWNEDLTDWAAALTYYAVLAFFPVLLVVLSVLGLSVPGSAPGAIDHITQVVPAASRGPLRGSLLKMSQQPTTAWTLVALGITGSLWSGSSYLSVFRRALHAMYGVDSHRPVWHTALRIVITALLVILLLVASAVTLMATGGTARRLGRLLDLDGATLAAWELLRWPAVLCLAVVLTLVVFRTGPAASRPLRRMAPGGVVAVLLWLTASAGFAAYASHVSTYQRVYGSLAGVAVFLVWLWLSNLSLLLGAQFNAQLAKAERGDRPPAGPAVRRWRMRRRSPGRRTRG
ncbi:YihY/virulence factor BrkB family protein [Streptantibioticus rubrisoli]|uniref:YihY/virulence factor BrkB family protein n=1 Tax=Streptantibioticus rubrisoli TaxID=1387313 RepID=A0ABT1P8M0_9ACTN|nr:YihY/virulence factor BrkB family protein [Streptantibioticus rubrisoli]MCQ4041714.1 YihY/virulence factor BrkB family protein [Streptantibioticus rubrisoli]